MFFESDVYLVIVSGYHIQVEYIKEEEEEKKTEIEKNKKKEKKIR